MAGSAVEEQGPPSNCGCGWRLVLLDLSLDRAVWSRSTGSNFELLPAPIPRPLALGVVSCPSTVRVRLYGRYLWLLGSVG
jgi:hypothetical protein